MAARPGPRLDAGDQGGRAGHRARERDRLLLRSQSRRHAARQGVRRADLRSHRAQGRSHRHRDHQPTDGAGVGAARHPAAGGASRRCARSVQGRRLDRRRAARRRPHRRLPLRRGAGRAARHRRRADHVPLSHALRRQEHGRSRHGAAPGPAAARHGDGAVPSDRAVRGTRHPHDRHRARGGLARCRRILAQRRHAPLHGRLRSAARARHPRRGQPRHLCRDAGRAHDPQWRALHQDGPPRPRERQKAVQGHGGALRRLRLRSRRRAGGSGADGALFHGWRGLPGRHLDGAAGPVRGRRGCQRHARRQSSRRQRRRQLDRVRRHCRRYHAAMDRGEPGPARARRERDRSRGGARARSRSRASRATSTG